MTGANLILSTLQKIDDRSPMSLGWKMLHRTLKLMGI
jgi:hypothetical protein